MAISEAELILPSLFLINSSVSGFLTSTELISGLRDLLKPTGDDLDPLKNRGDDKFSQKVRNLVSHNTLQKLGYVKFENSKFSITSDGISYLEEEDNLNTIVENYLPDFEGSETDEPGESSYDGDISKVYPQASLNIERTLFSVFELKRKKERDKLILDPDFQRNDVWRQKQKAELIESVLMNIPLPFIYLTENRLGELIVVDGRQRLTALFDFIDNKYSLGKSLKVLSNLNGRKFSELNPLMQGMIEDYQLTTHVIKPPISDRVLIDIFDRVNRGGTNLSNQEIRNALYQGKSTRLLATLSELESFRKATDFSVKSERMRDRYLILRFLAFYFWRKEYNPGNNKGLIDYKGDTEDFLPKYMQYINSFSDDRISEIEIMFNTAMINSCEILGANAFRLPSRKNLKRPISMALFELISYWMSDPDVVNNKNFIKEEYNNLINNEEFINSFLSIDANTKWRFDKIDGVIKRMHNVR